MNQQFPPMQTLPTPPAPNCSKEEFERFVVLSLAALNFNQAMLYQGISQSQANNKLLTEIRQRLDTIETEKRTAIKVAAAIAAILTGAINIALSIFRSGASS